MGQKLAPVVGLAKGLGHIEGMDICSTADIYNKTDIRNGDMNELSEMLADVGVRR